MWLTITEYIKSEFISNPIGLGGFVISVFLLIVHLKNRKLQQKFYSINRDLKRRNCIEFTHIISEQLEGSFINKLVVFNPSSQGIILQSLKVYTENKTRFPILQAVKLIPKWKKIDSVWWPTSDENNYEVKYLEDEYQNLYVDDVKVLLVSIGGHMDRCKYNFELKTSHDTHNRITRITGFNTNFSYEFIRRYNKNE